MFGFGMSIPTVSVGSSGPGLEAINYLHNSNDMDGSVWGTSTAITVYDDQQSPWGNLDGQMILNSATPVSNAQKIHTPPFAVSPLTMLCFSVYVKYITSDEFQLRFYNQTKGESAISNWSFVDSVPVIGTSGIVHGSGVQAVGNGFYRVYQTTIAATAGWEATDILSPRILPILNNVTPYLGLYFTGIQLDPYATPGPYLEKP